MKISQKQQNHIAKIINKEISWMVGWYCDEKTKLDCFNEAAKKIVKYLERKPKKVKK